ncbi:MAG TPA: hypothetical protein PLY76_05135, partial [Flavobacteriales bacterium]|nr:hypothetical protein [Flavobacteriales bacterium]
QQQADVRLIGMDGRLLRRWTMPRGVQSMVLGMPGIADAPYIMELVPANGKPERRRFVYLTGR